VAHCVLALGPDTAGALLREFVDGARARLDVAVYELGPSYAARLAGVRREGVEVRVLLDAHAGANATSTAILLASRVPTRVLGGHPGVEAHWKLLLADGTKLAAGTGNLLRRDAPPPGQAGTREWWAAVSGATRLHDQASGAFEAAWAAAEAPPEAWRRPHAVPAGVPPVGVPPHAAPPLSLDAPAANLCLALGGEAVAALLLERIGAARERVLATVPYVHTHVAPVRALLDAVRGAAHRGAAVRLLLGAPPEPRDALALLATGLPVRVMDPARSTTGHAKGVVVDAAAVVASSNWSGAGLGGNRESALLLDDRRAADWFAAALERDWRLARPLPAAPGPPDG